MWPEPRLGSLLAHFWHVSKLRLGGSLFWDGCDLAGCCSLDDGCGCSWAVSGASWAASVSGGGGVDWSGAPGGLVFESPPSLESLEAGRVGGDCTMDMVAGLWAVVLAPAVARELRLRDT